MIEQADIPSKKRGPKPIGHVPMTPAERQRRHREQLRAGGAKEFLMRLEGLHLEYIEKLAHADQVSAATSLKYITEASLDRFVGVMRRSERMLENGVPDEVREQFVRDHLFPALPPMPERSAQTNDAE